MSRFINSAKLRRLRENFYQKKFLENFQFNKKTWVMIMAFAIAVSSVCYLVQINCLATKGYEIQELDTKVSELKEINKKMQIEVTSLRSTERITQEIENLEMVDVAMVEYLQPNGSTVAINR